MKHTLNSALLLLFASFVLGIFTVKGEGFAQSPPSGKPQSVQAFSAVLWTTTTLHSRAGRPFTFMRRSVITRDSSGNVRREVYKPTKGVQHDTTAPLERVIAGSRSALDLPHMQSSNETPEQEADLGTLQFSGVPAAGRRQTFHDANGQRTRTQETWFSPALGLTVHAESRNARGDTVVSDLSELHLGDSISSAIGPAPAARATIPLLILYRSLFVHIAHLERDRLAYDPNRHVNIAEIEDQLQTKMNLSTPQWQILVNTSVKVEDYARDMSKEARNFADRDRAARRENPLGPNTLAAGRTTLHKMQSDLNTHMLGDIDELKAAVGSDAAGRIQAFVQGPVASSMTAIPVRSAQKERAR